MCIVGSRLASVVNCLSSLSAHRLERRGSRPVKDGLLEKRSHRSVSSASDVGL